MYMYDVSLLYSTNMGQKVHNYKRVIKGQGCMTIKGLV